MNRRYPSVENVAGLALDGETICLTERDSLDACVTDPLGAGSQTAGHESADYTLWEGGPLVGARLLAAHLVPLPERAAAVLSSRLGGPIETRQAWRIRMSLLFNTFVAGSRVVLTSAGTTCHQCLSALAAADQYRLMRVAPADFACAPTRCRDLLAARHRLGNWTPQTPTWPTPRRGCHQEIRVSPQLLSGYRSTNSQRQADIDQAAVRAIPLADRLLAALADDVYVLHARAGGAVARLISYGQRAGAFQHKRLFLASGKQAVPDTLRRQWLARGAIEWTVFPPTAVSSTATGSATGDLADPCVAPRPIPSCDDRSFLYHWTRRPLGPWPDQDESDYFEALMLDPNKQPRTALDALQRIATQKRLVATARLTRSSQPVVCLTERTLHEFPELRRFRRHQSRWDFERFGVAVSRDWLIARGARPVIYGDQQTWHALPVESRPFFQPYHGRGSASDWHRESEWRVVHDLDLRDVPRQHAFLFVPSMDDARRIAAVSDWSICVLEQQA